MITLRDLFDQDQLGAAIGDGYVRVQHHPTLPYSILNYTPKAMFKRAWTPVTQTCRGLIVHRQTEAIVARPFPKFFGVEDPLAGAVDHDEPVTATDKLDGALGILYPTADGEFAVATRGSFTSIPALHATDVWREKYADRWAPPAGMTALFEIIYPEWRIVIDYRDVDDLHLLAFVDIETGRSYSPTDVRGWPGPVAEVFPYRSFADAMAAAPREDAEGLVVHFLRSDIRKKIKQAGYVALHRLMFSLSSRRLWTHLAVVACKDHIKQEKHWASRLGMDPADAREALAAGAGWLDALVEDVPDEFYGWIRGQVAAIEQAARELRDILTATYVQYSEEVSGDRRAFVDLALPHEHSGALLLLFDQKDITTYLWRAVRPERETPFMTISEDVA